MAIHDDLLDATSEEGLYIGADHSVVMTVYSDAAKTACQDIAGWTIVLDVRRKDQSGAALLSVSGVVSGTYNATPASNTQRVTFTLSDDDLAASVFPGTFVGRYSVWRTDAGAEQPLRYGDCTITRTTRT